VVALIEAVDGDEEPLGHTDWAMFLTAALTGLRQSELLGLQWRDVGERGNAPDRQGREDRGEGAFAVRGPRTGCG
jgi:integrase